MLPLMASISAPTSTIVCSTTIASARAGMRDVVELGVFQDLPYADVAEILGIPEGTVKSRMFNALRKLKELMNERRS